MRIVVVDDEHNQRELLSGYLANQGFEIRSASSGQNALALLSEEGSEIVISDMKMPEMDGLTLLKEIKDVHPDTDVIVITAFATVETAVEAMKSGASDYIIKPVNLEHLMIIIDRIRKKSELVIENRYLKRKLESIDEFPDLIGESDIFKKMLADVAVIAQSDSTVLIRGESGTGKELIARAIHESSPVKDGPFLAVNCSALPETLLESELFGYEKGAFTGATRQRQGRFELADNGSLSLDEIGDISHSTQVKLLRVLENTSFERLGGTKSINVDIRLITATNRDLEAKIKDGSFREDLFYRLNVIPIDIPPLRRRKQDIMPLVNYFLGKYSQKSGKSITGLTPQAKDMILKHDYPGNVRELENVIERAVVLCRHDIIDADTLTGFRSSSDSKTTFSETLNLADLEKGTIEEALKQTGGNQVEAAKLLGIHRNTIRHKIKSYNIKT